MATTRSPRRPGRQKSDRPHPTDVQVGSRVRLRRNMLGFSQEKLGEAIGLTFQQVQKYERGANRIGASRLHELSQVLDVPVDFFYDERDPVRAPAIPTGFEEPAQEGFETDLLRRRETRGAGRRLLPDRRSGGAPPAVRPGKGPRQRQRRGLANPNFIPASSGSAQDRT